MKGSVNGWASDFPGKNNVCKEIMPNDGQVTITSRNSLTGDHAAIIMEYNLKGMGVTRMVHLTADTGLSGAIGSGSSAKDSTNITSIEEEPPILNDAKPFDASKLAYTCYDMTDSQRVALEAAIRRFKEKNDKGRYTYRLAGGLLGRLTTMPGKRGVNCADFIVKVLGEAKIVKMSELPISTPIGVVKRKGSVYVDLP